MMTNEENERLTRVGADTPVGKLMRHYWHPVAATSELDEVATKHVRILGEDLTLFRDKSARLGLIADRCAHRGVDLVHGIPETHGLRCPYHGWLYDASGQCLEQPAEPTSSTLRNRIKLLSYPVRELGGLIFAYLGKGPAPALPRWDRLIWTNVIRAIGVSDIQANWLQCTENSPDMFHSQWLHGRFYGHVLDREGVARDDLRYKPAMAFDQKIVKYQSDPFPYGFVRRTLLEGGTEESDLWKIGLPHIFPGINLVSGGGVHVFTYRVPIDDLSTREYAYMIFDPGRDVAVPEQRRIPWYDTKIWSAPGKVDTWTVRVQDTLMMEAQGVIADRTKENLGASDSGVVYFRRMLKDQIDLVEQGKTPMNVFPADTEAQTIELVSPTRAAFSSLGAGGYQRGSATRSSIPPGPVADEIEDLFERAAAERQRRQAAPA